MNCNTIEVCFTPALFPYRATENNFVVVIVDILRATTAICAAFDNGVASIIPVAEIEQARELKKQGYLVASERDGKKLDFADFGNSPFNFRTEAVVGKTIAYCTTNGTQAIAMARCGSSIVIGSFINLTALTGWLVKQDKNVLILCSGWKNKFNIEDSVFAGALTEKLLASGNFTTDCDSAKAAQDLWLLAKDNLLNYIEKAAHRHRLKRLGLDDVLEYCFTPDSTHVVPVCDGDSIVDACRKKPDCHSNH